METFAIPCVGALIELNLDNQKYLLIQERYKDNETVEKGLLEIPAGKIREYENIYAALRREVFEETGLEVIDIQGEDKSYYTECNGYTTMNYQPFACTQNLQGGYSILLQTFICRATGTLVEQTNESRSMRWVNCTEIETSLKEHPELFYPMHINTLSKYLTT